MFEANLGSGLIKKRIARRGEGKRGGHRVLLALKQSDRLVFLFGFSKNDRDNIDEEEKLIYKKLSHFYLTAPIEQLNKMCEAKLLFEIHYEKS